MPRVFISYRRDDTAAEAGRIADFLCLELGEQNVFFDLETIKGGDEFPRVIEEAVGGCDVLLAVIGSSWLSIAGPDGKRRLDDPNDFVRLEIAAALKRNVRVIPVLLHGAPVPKASDLPADLAAITRRNCIDMRELHFKQDVRTLLESIAGKKELQGRTLLRSPLFWLSAESSSAVSDY